MSTKQAKSRIMSLSAPERRQLRRSVIILKSINHSIQETTSAAEVAYRNYANNQSVLNWQIMNCVYAYLIIRTSAFYDELTAQFLKTKKLRKSKELVGGIAHFRLLYHSFHVRSFRNFLGHNRKTVHHKVPNKKNGRRRSYRPITDADIAPLSKLNSPQIYSSFGIATQRIVQFIDAL